ncbi:phosphatase PAP2 family protein [Streptomyces sp. NPDC127049]|uniref:phosphatase PAP2 family protein n=1 Tax=Streptomyces sp. NPDC127049 TaxID=3347118 RepID=UPI00364FB238
MTRTRGRRRYLAAGILLLVPSAVELSRMYRGMHHLSDVAGGLLNGTLTLLVIGAVFLAGRRTSGDSRSRHGGGTRPARTPAVSGAATPAPPPHPTTATGGRSAAGPSVAGRPRGGRAPVVRHPHCLAGCAGSPGPSHAPGSRRLGARVDPGFSIEAPPGTRPHQTGIVMLHDPARALGPETPSVTRRGGVARRPRAPMRRGVTATAACRRRTVPERSAGSVHDRFGSGPTSVER